KQDDKTKKEAKGKSHVESFTGYRDLSVEFEDCSKNSSNEVNAASTIVPTIGQNSPNSTNTFSVVGPSNVVTSPTYRKSSFKDASQLPDDPDMPELEDITYSNDENNVGVEVDFNNLETYIIVNPIQTTRIHKDHPVSQIIGDLSSTTQTRSMTRVVKDQGGLPQMFNDDFHTCMFACFLSQEEPKREEGIDYEEVFAPVVRIKAIRLFLAYASFMGFMVYQMDVKSAFLYGTIEEEVYVCQPSGFEDLDHPDKVYKVVKALYGLHQAPRSWKFRLSEGKSASTPIDTEKPLLKEPDGQTTTGKEISNPFMAGSLPKTILHTFIHDNDVTMLQALVDKKKVVVTEAAIREVLWLDDAEGVDCLSNKEIFIELSTSANQTSWNEFSSAMASAVICLSTGDEEEHVEDVTAGDAAQGDDTAAHGEVPTVSQELSIPSPTPPTPPPQPPQDLPSTSQVQHTPPQSPQAQPQPQLQQAADFPMSLLQEALDACTALTRRVKHLEYDKVAQALEITKLKRRVKKLEKGNRVRVLKLRRLKRVGTSQRINTSNDTVMDDESNQGRIINEMDKDDVVALMDDKEEDKKDEEDKIAKVIESDQEDEPVEVQEVVDVVTTAKLIIEVVTATSKIVTVASTIISTAKSQVPAAIITYPPTRVVVAPSRRRKGMVIKDPKEESTTSSIIFAKTKSKDKGKGIMVEEHKPLKKKQPIEMDEEYARKLHAELNKDIDWDVDIDHVKLKAKEDPNVAGFRLEYFKGISYDVMRLIFEAKFNSNVDFLLKTKEQMEEEESIALQRINETPAEKAAKRRKLNKEVEDLKRHLEIVPDEDDDVYVEVTPLARKVPVMDYEIIEINNKPYYKIIRADGTHQLYISFLTLLKNFDRVDLEALWNLVKERFSTAKPKNIFDDFLLTTLGAIEELSAAKQKLMLLDNAVEARLMLLSHINVVKLQNSLIGSPSLTTVDQDAPSASNSQTLPKTQSPIISNDVKEENHDLDVAYMNNYPFFGILILKNISKESSSLDVIPTVVHTTAPNSEHVNKWTKDHPFENIIGEHERPVSIRLQLHKQALFCYYDAFLTSVEPKTYKDVLVQACWIEAMQEELNEFKRLKVWELVPRPDKVMVITLKWIYKFLLSQEFSKGIVDPPLFIRRQGKDILLLKYALESLKKYGMESSNPMDTPMVKKSKLDEDPQGKVVDPTHYRGMVGTLMYLTASRPNLTFDVCMCAPYQAKPIEKHLHSVKRIFKYLRGTVNRGLWYLKDSSIVITAYADADHAGCQDTRRSISRSMQLLGDRLISWSSKRLKSVAISSTKAEYIALSGCCAQELWMRS
nr:uncharacterized mitochondrial protein AtMg00810-like [Tanacetum cinerariifolium]